MQQQKTLAVASRLYPLLRVLPFGLALVLSPCISYAGEWQFDHNEYQNGISKVHEDAWSGYISHPATGSELEWGVGGATANNTAYIYPRGSAGYSHHTGQVRTWMRYVPRKITNANGQLVDDPTDVPPPTVSIKVSATGTAKASDGGKTVADAIDAGRYGGQFYVTDPGAYSVSLSLLGKQAIPVPADDGLSISATLDVRRLLQARSQEQTLVALPWCDIQAKATVSGSDRADYPQPNYPEYKMPLTGTTEVGATYNAVLDNRSVRLSRGGRYEFQILAGGEWHTYDDSIYSAHDANRPTTQEFEFENPLTIMATPEGTWTDPSSLWAPTGFDRSTGQGLLYYSGITLFGTPLVGTAVNLTSIRHPYIGQKTGPTTHTTSYTATDSDGATATAHYHLTLHDPVEVIGAPALSTFNVDKPLFNADPGCWFNGPVTNGKKPDGTEVSITSAYSEEYGQDLTASIDIDPFDGLVGLQGGVSYNRKSTLTITSKLTPPDTLSGFSRYAYASHSMNRKHVRFYKYDALGKVKRLVTSDFLGNQFNPAQEGYHEAFRDYAGIAIPHWSVPIPGNNFDASNLPSTPAPPLDWDYLPSGGSA